MSIEFNAPPTIAAFMESAAFGRLLAGPVGSGKTTGCVIELLRRSAEQAPAADGYRYTRHAIVRQTLRQLKDTVLKDVQNWCGPLGEWRVTESCFHLRFGDVRSEWLFIPLEDAADQARLLSMQLTGAWLSECIEMNIDVLAPLSGRLNRYPSGSKGVATWCGLIADTNFPTEMTPWHQLMEHPPGDWQIFKQPSGLSPDAENLNWLAQTADTIKLPIDHPARIAQGRSYYERFVSMYGEDSDWVKRYVKAAYGDDPSGSAVFKNTFRAHTPDGRPYHVVPDTTVIPGYPLLIGQDFGRNPWSLICQVDHRGRVIVHEEVPATNVGLERHVQERLKAVLWQNRYVGARLAVVGDPAGRAKENITEESCFDALKRFGLFAYPAPTNDIEPRLRAVEMQLGRQVDTGPGLMINAQRCPMLVRAMSGGYRFTKTKQGGLRVVPEKNDPEGFSHVADCLQYVCLVAAGTALQYLYRAMAPRSGQRPVAPSAKGWT